MIIETKYDMGMELKDTVIGFKGIVIAIATYLNGCIRYGKSNAFLCL